MDVYEMGLAIIELKKRVSDLEIRNCGMTNEYAQRFAPVYWTPHKYAEPAWTPIFALPDWPEIDPDMLGGGG